MADQPNPDSRLAKSTGARSPSSPGQDTAPVPTKRSAALRVVRTLLLIYIVWCGVLYFLQTGMVFPATMAGSAGPPFHPDTQILQRQVDGAVVRAWLILPEGADAQHPAPLLMFFHGNAELIDHQADLAMAYLRRGFAVLLPEYRGYGHSEGKPSEANIVQDAVHFYDEVTARPEINGGHVIMHGRSIGGAVAAQVASRRTPAALILESAPANIARMAWRYGVPPVLVANPFRTDEALAQLDIPILLFHGTRDGVVPFSHGRRLHEVAADSILIEFDTDHNDVIAGKDRVVYWGHIDTIIAGGAGD